MENWKWVEQEEETYANNAAEKVTEAKNEEQKDTHKRNAEKKKAEENKAEENASEETTVEVVKRARVHWDKFEKKNGHTDEPEKPDKRKETCT